MYRYIALIFVILFLSGCGRASTSENKSVDNPSVGNEPIDGNESTVKPTGFEWGKHNWDEHDWQ